MTPRTPQSRGKNSCNGTQTKAERKYFSTTVQMPSSICASVPMKTRPIASAIRTTVSLSEASASTARMTGPRRSTGFGCVTGSPAVGAGGGGGGADDWMAVLSTVTSVEFHGAEELV